MSEEYDDFKAETQDITNIFDDDLDTGLNDDLNDLNGGLNDDNNDNDGLDNNDDNNDANNDADDANTNSNNLQFNDFNYEDDLYSIKPQKLAQPEVTQKKKTKRTNSERPPRPRSPSPTRDYSLDPSDPSSKRRLLEEKMDLAVKSKGLKRKKADEDDLERMQDDRIDYLKDQMIKAANLDVEKNSQGLIATEKLKLLPEVKDIISRADLSISILDNNLLEAVRLWLEPLPDASMPAYQIQKDLIFALENLPIKTDHLVASGIGKILVFYQKSKRTEPILKRVVDRLIGDWTRPILNKSDSYKDRTVKFHDYNKNKFINKLASSRKKSTEAKSLYEQNAERKKRAAIPSARTTAYKVAPRVDPSVLRRNFGRPQDDERFKRINTRITSMSQKKKQVKKNGPSIEGRNLTM